MRSTNPLKLASVFSQITCRATAILKPAARATTPTIPFDRTREYVISLKFYVPSAQTWGDKYIVVADDSRAIVDYNIGYAYAGFMWGGPKIPVLLSYNVWHTIELRVHPSTSSYHVVIDGTQYGPYSFYASGTDTTISVGSRPPAAGGKEYMDAYYDDVKLVQ